MEKYLIQQTSIKSTTRSLYTMTNYGSDKKKLVMLLGGQSCTTSKLEIQYIAKYKCIKVKVVLTLQF